MHGGETPAKEVKSMKIFEITDAVLTLFDAGAGADGAQASGSPGDTTAGSDNTHRSKSGETQVVYGQQDTNSDAGSQADVVTTSNTLEDRRKAWQEMVSGEYKDLYTEGVQRVIDRRFRETKNLEQQVAQYQPVIDMLMQRYNVQDVAKLGAAIENDNAYWEAAAEEAGLSVEQFKQLQKLQRENAALMRQQKQQRSRQMAQQQLAKWDSEAQELKKLYPSFDLAKETENREFLSLLRSGVPVQHAYEVVHMDEIKAGIASMQAKATEKQIVEGIRARGTRPQEAGASSSSAFVVKDDVHKLTKKDRADIARRVARGEIIKF